jgi:hypothetical protein
MFTKHPENIALDVGPACCIYHKQYAKTLPQIADCEFLEYDAFSKEYESYSFAGKTAMVFVGANKFFNSSTRIHPVMELLPYGLPTDMQLISVDTAPYIGPLWRLWAHFYFTKVPFGEYTYSYLLESHFNGFLDGIRSDNPLSLEKIGQYAAGHVSIDYDRFFAEPVVDIIEMSPAIHADYQELKEQLFEEHDHIQKVIRGLADFAKASCPERYLPAEHKIFETPEKIHISRTDLKVDEYLTGKLLGKMLEVNRVCEVLQQ